MRRIQWLLVVLLGMLGESGFVRAAVETPPNAEDARIVHYLPPLFRAALCIVANRSEQSIALCDEVLRGDPNNARAYALRGYARLLTQRQATQAIADFREVLRRDPDNAAVHLARAQAYHQAKDDDRAIADCTEVIRIDPLNSEAHATRATLYFKKKATSKAIADYTSALRINPEFIGARRGRAAAYFRVNDSARALADVAKILSHNPEDRVALFLRCAVYLYCRNDYDRAIAEAGDCIRRDPSDATAYSLRWLANLGKGEIAKSLGDVVAVALLTKGSNFQIRRHSLCWSSASFSSDFIYSEDDDSEERMEACTQRLGQNPSNMAAYYERASAYLVKHDYERALSDFEDIIRLDPKDAEAYRTRGSLRLHFKAEADALEDFNTAMRLDSDNVENYVGRARVYAAMKRDEEAWQDCVAALRMDSSYYRIYDAIGWICFNRKEYDKAIAAYTEAIRLCPADSTLYLRRARARQSTWDCAGVIEDYKEIVKRDPSNALARARLAWFLSGSPYAHLRNGKEARKLALQACEETSWRNAEVLSSLAIACAECGDFDDAVKWGTKAVEYADDSEKEYCRHCLEIYRAHKPYHDSLPQGISLPPSNQDNAH